MTTAQKNSVFLPKEEWVMYKDETGEVVPAIVSEEIWNKCNRIFETRSAAIKSREHSFKDTSVFTGKIWCAAHDKHIGGQVTQTAYQKVSQYINGYVPKRKSQVQKAVRHLQ